MIPSYHEAIQSLHTRSHSTRVHDLPQAEPIVSYSSSRLRAILSPAWLGMRHLLKRTELELPEFQTKPDFRSARRYGVAKQREQIVLL